MNTDRAVTAIVSILATAAAGYFGVARPAVEQASTANAGLDLAQQLLVEKETTLAKREAQIERREAKIDALKEKLEACR